MAVVPAADQGPDGAVAGQRHQGRLGNLKRLAVGRQQAADAGFGVGLQARVEGRRYGQVLVAGENIIGDLFQHPVDEITPEALCPPRREGGLFPAFGGGHVFAGQVPGSLHVGQDLVGAPGGQLGIGDRVVAGRRFQEPGQQGRLVDAQIARRAAEVFARRRLDAVGAGPQIDPVEVDGENLILGELAFQPQGQQQFLHFALEGPVRLEKKVLSRLLGDGAAALDDAPGPDIGHHGPRQADDIEAEMLVKAPVLGGQHGLRQGRGQLAQFDRRPVEIAAGGQGRAVGGEDGNRRAAGGGNGRVHIGQVGGVPGHHPADQDYAPDGGDPRPFEEAHPPAPLPERGILGFPTCRHLYITGANAFSTASPKGLERAVSLPR